MEFIINIVNKKTHKPTEHDFYIGRPSPLGNPFSHLPKSAAKFRVATRNEAVEKYDEYLAEQIKTNQKFRNEIDKIIDHLKKHGIVNLVCWCAPQSCHGGPIKKFIERILRENQEFDEQCKKGEIYFGKPL